VKALLLAAAALLATPATAQDYSARVAKVLKATPLIDGHNDWPEALREREAEARWTDDLNDLSRSKVAYNTDIARLRRGKVGAQFWSVWVDPSLPGTEQVKETIEQIALVQSLPERYPAIFALARTAADVRRIHASGRIACLIGVEGGGQIDGSLGVLRAYAALGAGYLTLTHSRTIDWADSATDDPKHGGLTAFGRTVVTELNRLGMLVDLSHVSETVMRDALAVTRAPVIFSHSSARAIDDHPRNVPDEVLKLSQVADHIVHIAKVAGVDHVGLGSDYDGVGETLPQGLGDVSTYPALLAELMRRGWSDADVAKLAGGNVLRVMEAAERVKAEMATRP
jgi:membrane dipeptidase